MQRTGSSNVREAVEAKEVSKALERAKDVTTEEEKVLRMRHGSRVKADTALERHGRGNPEVQDELLLLEMQLLKAYREHQKLQARKTQTAAQPSRTKDKIVRALRKKH